MEEVFATALKHKQLIDELVLEILSEVECDSTKPMNSCKNPDCSWFNHSQVGLRPVNNGNLPEGYKDE